MRRSSRVAPIELTDHARRMSTTVESIDERSAVQDDWAAGSVAITSRSLCNEGTALWARGGHAARTGIALIGRCQGRHDLRFTARERFIGAPPPP